MIKQIFGTDGIRGKANQYPLDIDTCIKLTKAIHIKFLKNKKKPTILIGKDTRLSGDTFEHIIAAVFSSLGSDVKLMGVMPTPAVSILTKKWNADLGIMISASHNPYYDNGIKIFNAEGFKLTDDEEFELENTIFNQIHENNNQEFGTIKYMHEEAEQAYCNNIIQSFNFNTNQTTNKKVIIDSANGALSNIAGKIFKFFGFNVINLFNNPNGININENCGATHPDILSSLVLKHLADFGIAFDGDGDRVILCDEKGQLFNGDEILSILLIDGNHAEVVSTIMSNFGFEKYLEKKNIKLTKTNVGDKYVSEYIKNSKANIGGETSGHIIIKSHAPTGDGLFSGLKAIQIILKNGGKFSEYHMFEPYPTVSKNVKVKDKSVINSLSNIIQNYQNQLGNEGRLIVRPSGTEPLIRVSAEGKNTDELKDIVSKIEEAILKC